MVNTPPATTYRFRRYLLLSIGLHAVLFGIIAWFLFAEQEHVDRQEQMVLEQVRAEEERAELARREEQAAQEKAAKDQIAEQLQAEMEHIIDGELLLEDQQALTDMTAEDIEAQLENLDDQTAMSEMTNEEFYELADNLRRPTFEEMQANLKQMKQQLLLSQVRNFIREQVAPDIKNRINQRLERDLGRRLRSEAVRIANANVRTPKKNRKDPQTQAEIAAAKKQLVDEAMKEIEKKVREELAKEVKDTAVPIAADRIMKAIQPELEKQKLNDKAFREFVKKDIRKALEEETKKQQPQAAKAVKPTKEQYKLPDLEAMEQAAKEAAEIAKKLAELAKTEEAVRDQTAEKTVARDATRQEKLAEKIKDAHEKASKTLSKAGVTAAAKKTVEQANEAMKNAETQKKADQAAKDVRAKKLPEAKKQMTEVAKHLKDAAKKMQAVSQKLDAEVKKAKELAKKRDELQKRLGEEKAKEAVEDLKKAGEKLAKEKVKPAAEMAAQQANLRGLRDLAKNEALQKMNALDGKLDQIAENMRQGRGFGDEMTAGMLGLEGGRRPGISRNDGLFWSFGHSQSMSRFNRKAFEEFMKNMRNRMHPENYYEDEEEVEGMDSVARRAPEKTAALVYVERNETPAAAGEKAAGEKSGESEKARAVPKPTFPVHAFGAAAMMEKPVKIDGDLSDWGELKHGVKVNYLHLRGADKGKVVEGATVYIRWSPDGVYFAYTVKDDTGIQPCPKHTWDGDCFEVMIDLPNSRREDSYRNLDSQKFVLTPFGALGKTDTTVWEMGRGIDGKVMAKSYPDTTGRQGQCAAKKIPGGYSVETFLTRSAFTKPMLFPGKYVGMNFFVNTDIGKRYLWSSPGDFSSWRRPNTWGDVLLLGSDAKLRFTSAADPEKESPAIVPGEPLHVEIADADMNLNTRKVDRVAARLATQGPLPTMFIVLKETGVNTGVFRGSVDTQQYFMPARENTLNLRSGNTVELHYTDARAEYGEKNRPLKVTQPVGWPVMTVGKK